MKEKEEKVENTENAEKAFEEAKATLEEAKADLSEAKGAFRKWKKENKIRKIEGVKDDKLKDTFSEFEYQIEELTAAREEAQDAMKAAKPKKGGGVGGSKYQYGTYTNKDGEEIKVDSKMTEGKRWRNHARKVAAKEGIEPHEVEWDPKFFLPKVKAEKESKKEDKKEDKKEAPKGEAKKVSKEEAPKEEKPSRRARRKKD